jgi:GNAT superfamily N-acetyltransferase
MSARDHFGASQLPAEFTRDITLRNGTALRLRALRDADRNELVALFNRCSPESIRFRFLRLITSLPDSLLDQLVSVDGTKHVAIVVVRPENAEGRVVAIGRYFALDDRPEVAEVAFLVEDEMQRRGIGTILLDTLAEIARLHGITRFAADVLADNLTMLSVFRKAGYALSSSVSYGVTHLEFSILSNELDKTRAEDQPRSDG